MTYTYSEPVQTCKVCNDYEIVRPDGRGFPLDIAKRKLAKRRTTAGHKSEPQYTAGLSIQIPEGGLIGE